MEAINEGTRQCYLFSRIPGMFQILCQIKCQELDVKTVKESKPFPQIIGRLNLIQQLMYHRTLWIMKKKCRITLWIYTQVGCSITNASYAKLSLPLIKEDGEWKCFNTFLFLSDFIVPNVIYSSVEISAGRSNLINHHKLLLVHCWFSLLHQSVLAKLHWTAGKWIKLGTKARKGIRESNFKLAK